MTEDNDIAVVIMPQAWSDLYEIAKPFLKSMAEWGQKHEQPLAVAEGAVWGMAQLLYEMGDGCDCDVCTLTAEAVADELSERMTTRRVGALH